MKHLAIIMDGNRRWAKERFMPAIFWHKAWFDNVKRITRLADQKGIEYLTLWALSTENYKKRGEEEIKWIIKLIHVAQKLVPEFMENNVRLKTIWDTTKLPEKTQSILASMMETTKDNNGITLTIALVYGWQDEIIRACQKILQEGKDPSSLSKEEFRSYLDTAFLPEADVIVRTGWDIRHSGFLLYDSAYSEYYFTEKKWPEFDESELDKVIDFFHGSKRNFWK